MRGLYQILDSLLVAVNGTNRGRPKIRRQAPRHFKPCLECFEDRMVPSTVSSITSSFNGTAIPAGDYLWFNSAFTASGLPKAAAATIHVEDQAIDFTAGGMAYHVAVPNSVIVLTPGTTS